MKRTALYGGVAAFAGFAMLLCGCQQTTGGGGGEGRVSAASLVASCTAYFEHLSVICQDPDQDLPATGPDAVAQACDIQADAFEQTGCNLGPMFDCFVDRLETCDQLEGDEIFIFLGLPGFLIEECEPPCARGAPIGGPGN